MTVLSTSVTYAAIGGVAVTLGATFATYRELADRARSLVQHAAAGTVLAGLVVDVLTKLERRPDQLIFTAIGLLVGLAAMLAVRRWAPDESSGAPGSLVLTVVIDILVDGVLIGLSAALGPTTGLVFAVALAPEMFLLGTTAADQLSWPRPRIIGTAAVIGLGITASGALGWLVAQAPDAIGTLTLGLGASALMYLVLEELLRESHEEESSTIPVAMLFAGFLPFFLAGVAFG